MTPVGTYQSDISCSDLIEVISSCERKLSRYPQELPTLELRAKTLWRAGRYEEALEALRETSRLNPNDPGYEFLKGDCLQQLLRLNEAAECFSKCLQSGPSPAADQAATRLEALRAWQTGLIGELSAADHTFRGLLTNQAVKALGAYGFSPSLQRRAQKKHAVFGNLHSPSFWARPS